MAEQTISILAYLKDQISGPLKEISGNFDGLRNELDQIGKSLDPVLAKLGRLSALLAGVSLGGAAYRGTTLAARLEQTELAWEIIIGDVDVAMDALENLVTFTAETPFQWEGVEKSAKTLLTYGTAVDSLIPTLRMLGDVASGVNGELTEFATIYGRVQQSGRLMRDQIEQMSSRGVKIWESLRQQLGVETINEVREAAARGELTFSNLEQTFRELTQEGGQFYNMMIRQSQTVNGLFSTLRDNIETVLEAFAYQFLPRMREFLTFAIEKVAYFKDELMDDLVISLDAIIENALIPGAQLLVTWGGSLLEVVAAAIVLKLTLLLINKSLVIANTLSRVLSLTWTLIAAKAAILPATLALIAVALLDITARLAGVEGGILGIAGETRGLVDDFRDGFITTPDLIDASLTSISAMFIRLSGVIKSVAKVFKGEFSFEDFRDRAQAIMLVVGSWILLQMEKITVGITGIFTESIRWIAKQFDSLMGLIADAVAKIPKFGERMADSLRTNLEATVPDPSEYKNALKVLEKTLEESLEENEKSRARVAARAVNREKSTSEQIEDLWKAYEKRTTDRQNERLSGDSVEDRAERVRLKNIEARAERIRELNERILKIEENENREAAEAIKNIRLQELADQHRKSLISARAYADARLEIELKDIQAQQSLFNMKLAVERERFKELEEGSTDQEVSLRSQAGLVLTLQTIEFRRLGIVRNIETAYEAMAKAEERLALSRKQATEDAEVRLMRLKGLKEEADLQDRILSQERERFRVRESLGDSHADALAEIHELELAEFRVSQAREKANKIVNEVGEAERRYREELGLTAQQLIAGTITLNEGYAKNTASLDQFQAKIRDSNDALLEQLELTPQLKDEFQSFVERVQLLKESLDPAQESLLTFTNNVLLSLQRQSEQLGSLARLGEDVGNRLASSLGDGLIDAFESAIDGTKSLEDSFRDMAVAILQDIGRMIIRMLIFKAIAAAVGGPAGAAMPMPMASGGEVPGPDNRRDSVPTVLMPKEWVIRRDSAQYYGRGVMAALNRRDIPRELFAGVHGTPVLAGVSNFSQGGEVNKGARSTTPQVAVIAPSPEAFSRLLQGGRSEMLEFLADNGYRAER
jgi:hypothetical protein